MTKSIALALAFSLILSLIGGIPAQAASPIGASRFTDINTGDWFYPYVDRLTKEGTIRGVSADSFDPARSVSRGEFVSLLL